MRHPSASPDGLAGEKERARPTENAEACEGCRIAVEGQSAEREERGQQRSELRVGLGREDDMGGGRAKKKTTIIIGNP